MATAASQPYIAKLGFSDPDRSKDRHGLACEYLFERLLELEVAPAVQDKQIEYLQRLYRAGEKAHSEIDQLLKTDPRFSGYWRRDHYTNAEIRSAIQAIADKCADVNAALDNVSATYPASVATAAHCLSTCVSRPIETGYQGKHTAGFADVLLKRFYIEPLVDKGILYDCGWNDSHSAMFSPTILGEVKITKQSAETVLQQINYYRQHIEGGVDKVYILTDYDCSDLQRLTQGSDISVYRLGKRFEDWIAARSMPSTPEL
jgi:hypothetical protein